MIPRRALISLLVVVTFALTMGCAGRSEQASYQEITVPESPEDVNIEGTKETESEPDEEPEAMAEGEETPEETTAEQPEPEPAGEEMGEETVEAQPQEETSPEPEEEPTEPASEEDAEPTPTSEETRRGTPMEEKPSPEKDTSDETEKTPEVQPEPAPAEPAEAEPAPLERPRPEAIEADEALAIVYPTRGHRMGGWVHFREVEGGVRVLAKFKGLKPNQKHGFHIHEYGDFGDRKGGLTAGGHYDPKNTGQHGRPSAGEPHHAGDLGNLEANADGVAGYDRVIKGISVAGGPNPILGRAVVVHTQPDDFSQPSGNAGPRLGLGVIGVANPE